MGGMWKKLSFLLLLYAVALRICGAEDEEPQQYQWDEHGYVLYCPCMGRFGNQASHFLGALAFAKGLNRTLAVPPWRTYVRQRNVPFTDFFQLSPVQSYHKSLSLEDFMEQLAPLHWPPENRTGYCYRSLKPEVGDCEMKSGNPFGPFWDELGVDFVRSEFTELTYDLSNQYILKRWQENYPPDKHPVLAFKGAPARFPVLREHRHLHKYVRWNDQMNRFADEYIRDTMGGGPFVGVHLRIGSDWVRACDHVKGHKNFMESPQCLDDLPEATVTQDMCLPSRQIIAEHIQSVTDDLGISKVYISSDSDPDIPDLQRRLGTSIQLFYPNPATPQEDLVVLGRSQHFIGNCVSSFTAFVKRERDSNHLPSSFFGFYPTRENERRTEL